VFLFLIRRPLIGTEDMPNAQWKFRARALRTKEYLCRGLVVDLVGGDLGCSCNGK
jgi:hypothetical protein